MASFGPAAFVFAPFVEGSHVLVDEPVIAFGHLALAGNFVGDLLEALRINRLQCLPLVEIVGGQDMGIGQPPGALWVPEQASFAAVEFDHVGVELDLVETVLEQGPGHSVGELQRGCDMVSCDRAVAAGCGQYVMRADRAPARGGMCGDALAVTTEFNHMGQQVGTDLHQAETAVIAFAAGVDIAQIADLTLLIDFVDRLGPCAEPPLVMHCDLHPFGRGFVHHRIGFDQVHPHRLFDFDIDAVFEHSQRQRGVQGWCGGDRHDIRLCFADHGVQIVVACCHAQFVAQGIEALGEEVAKADDFGPRVCVIDPGGRRPAGAAAQYGDAIRFHSDPFF